MLGDAGSSPVALRAEIRKVRSLTSKPFGVDLLLPSNVARTARAANGDAADWRAGVPQSSWDAIAEL